ncbi:MAG: septum formation initiator family protein [Lachnospiraceae bacterium]|nr:septum formation initiator family protein [Lachnospiraceae bacterium]
MAGRTRKRRKKKKRLSGRDRAGVYLITFVVCTLFCVLLTQGMQLRKSLIAGEQTRSEIQAEIEEEEERTASINELKEYMQTDDYVRQVAKERLGLVEKDEIIFIEAE